MAYLRKRDTSSYWYLIHRATEDGKWKEISTQLRWDDKAQTREAERMEQKYTRLEGLIAPDGKGDFRNWVPTFIETHYQNDHTRERMEFAWTNIAMWLTKKKLNHPRKIKYEHGEEYMTWRKETASHNTARLELRFLSSLMVEAIRREYCEKNPLALTRVRRAPAKQKPALSGPELVNLRTTFASGSKRHEGKGYAPWMGIVHEILSHIGCRFNEASIPEERLDFEKCIITVEDSKRKPDDPKKFYQVVMSEQLKGILEPWMKDRDRTVPILTRDMLSRFNKVMKRIVGTTSHAYRVSFITRCYEGGLTEKEAMDLVNHSDEQVHEIYRRLDVEHKRRTSARVAQPPAPPAP